jgi:hypothetical protein
MYNNFTNAPNRILNLRKIKHRSNMMVHNHIKLHFSRCRKAAESDF